VPTANSTTGNDTIAAISTPPGRGGIGIVRLSGPQALEVAAPLLRLKHPLAHVQARFAHILDLETGRELDEAIVTLFSAPHSYTGEDLIEIAAHGSPVLLEHILRGCLQRGARLAEPGEFTQRAWLSGRIDLTQAEAVRDLIDAHTLHQARIAAQQLGGSLARSIAPLKRDLVALIATLEAGMDFAAGEDLDDIDVLPPAQIAARIEALRAPLATLAASYAYGRIVRDGLTLALVGRPNAGKSSLFNRLIQRDRAIVTATPGTTRDLVTERFSLEGIPITLVDTAGLRHASESEAEALGIAKSREALADADLVLHVLDATQPRTPEDEALASSLADRPHLTLINKSDLVEQGDNEPDEAIPTSALTGAGIPELRAAILTHIHTGAAGEEAALLTNLRQRQAVEAALEALAAATQAVAAKLPHELLLVDLYNTLRALDTLTGVTTTDDILHLIFSTFCIGK